MLDRPKRAGRTSSSRNPSGSRIALTLAGVVIAGFLLIWGVGAVAAAFMGGMTPPPETPSTTAVATSSAEATKVAKVATTTPKPKPKAPSTKPKAPPAKAPAPKPAPAPANTGKVVVIDAGHQGKGDSAPEPIGPGSSQTKPKVKDGAEGSVTHVRESVVNLAVALKLRDVLVARGVKVVMVRTSEDVNISNSQRAKIGNENRADLVVRVHCDDIDSSSVNGFMTVVPDSNQWTGPIVDRSAKAGRAVQKAALAATGAHDRGVQPPAEPMTGFNFSTVPTIIVEMGLMSNAAEDRKLNDAGYQNTLATGIGNGVMDYLNGK